MARVRNRNRTKVDYRKIWMDANGPIPIDDQGRPYHIHHIDGNSYNNSLENLKAVSLKEHYEIHLAQGDWAVVQLLSTDLELSAEEYLLVKEKAAEAVSKAVRVSTGEVFPSLRALHQLNLIKLRMGKNKGKGVGYSALVSIVNDPSDLRVEFVNKPKDPVLAAKLLSQRAQNLSKRNADFTKRAVEERRRRSGGLHERSKRCMVKGQEYPCIQDAAKCIGVDYSTVIRWLGHKAKYLDCYYLDPKE